MSKTYTHVFLDFDETLFNHYAYADWIDDVLAKKFGKPPGFFKNHFEGHHEQLVDPLLRIYRHREHFKAVTGRDWDYISGELEYERHQQNRDFCFPDSHELLQWLTGQPYDVRILTFGDGEYQRHKLNTCQVIRRLEIPVHVVREAKRDFLKRSFGDTIGVLIDDKHPLELPANWHEIHVRRQPPLSSPQRINDRIYRVSSLGQVKELLNA